jgi:hypothetical protein
MLLTYAAPTVHHPRFDSRSSGSAVRRCDDCGRRILRLEIIIAADFDNVLSRYINRAVFDDSVSREALLLGQYESTSDKIFHLILVSGFGMSGEILRPVASIVRRALSQWESV